MKPMKKAVKKMPAFMSAKKKKAKVAVAAGKLMGGLYSK